MAAGDNRAFTFKNQLAGHLEMNKKIMRLIREIKNQKFPDAINVGKLIFLENLNKLLPLPRRRLAG